VSRQSAHATRLDVLGRPSIRLFGDADGLPQNSSLALARDRRGYVWVGTQDGAASYNGRAWTVVNLPNRSRSNVVRSVLATSDGSIWFGTLGGGLARLTGDAWTVYDTSNCLPHDEVRCLLETPGPDGPEVWVGTTRGGLARYDGRHWRAFSRESGLPSDGILSLASTVGRDGTRRLWSGTVSAGLACFDGRRWTSFDVPSSSAQLNNVLSILEDADDEGMPILRIGTPVGLHTFDLESLSFRGRVALPSTSFFALARTTSRNGSFLWAGSGIGMLHRIERDRCRTYGESSGLPAGRILCLLAAGGDERPRALWVGTDAGIALLDEHGWWTLDERFRPPHKVAWSFADATMGQERALCVGTDGGGVAILGERGMTVHNTSTELPNDVVWSLAESIDGSAHVLHVGTEGGLASHNGDRWEVLDVSGGLRNQYIRALLPTTDRDGTPELWMATGAGVTCKRGSELTHYDETSGLSTKEIWCLLETVDGHGRRAIWAGSRGGGLAALIGGRWRVFDSSSGLPNDRVLCMHESRSADGERTLWVGLQGGGIARRNLADPDARWSVLDDSTSPAIPNNTVYQIREDARGALYVTTNKGVARLTPRTPTEDDASEFSIDTFTTEDGLPSNECNAGASLIDASGCVWVGTVEGVAIYDPRLEVADATAKPLHIERVRLNGIEVSLEDQGVLRHDENNLEFEYALLSIRRVGQTRYRAQLAGFDRAPSDWTFDYRRNYTNLPQGSYEFRVWGRDCAGNVSGPVSTSFHIKPAPWRTWWAKLLYAGALTGAGVGAVRYRIRTLQQRSEELQTLVDARTRELASTVDQLRESEQRAQQANQAKSVFLSNMSHELRTPLNAVIGLAELLERDQSIPTSQRETVAIIQRSGEHLLGLINDVLSLAKIEAGKITLHLQPFDLDALLRSVEQMTRLRADSKGIEIVFDVDPSLARPVLGDEGKLRQVLINLLGNAVKFTERGRIDLIAYGKDSEGRVGFEVRDTGAGIDAAEFGALFEAFEQTETGVRANEGTGLGLTISREIVRLMGGEIWVRSEPGRGTTFGFEIDLAHADGASVRTHRRVVGLAPDEPEWRLLVADDTAENRRVLSGMLTQVGFVVREAADGAEAVASWRDWQPHLVWMDVRMKTMDGMEATRRIRAEERSGAASGQDRRATRIVAVTASVFEHEQQAIRDAGADDLVVKPFRESTILAKVAEHLGTRFVYERANEPQECTDLAQLAKRAAVLPEGLVSDVHAALWVGDAETALAASEAIRPHDPGLADEIARRIRCFEFNDVLAIVRPRD
jgi:signal transduction histidine kinase/ligand-binding sensor domain-containing protein/DNA-binding NarL/FixJ family response regulator